MSRDLEYHSARDPGENAVRWGWRDDDPLDDHKNVTRGGFGDKAVRVEKDRVVESSLMCIAERDDGFDVAGCFDTGENAAVVSDTGGDLRLSPRSYTAGKTFGRSVTVMTTVLFVPSSRVDCIPESGCGVVPPRVTVMRSALSPRCPCCTVCSIVAWIHASSCDGIT